METRTVSKTPRALDNSSFIIYNVFNIYRKEYIMLSYDYIYSNYIEKDRSAKSIALENNLGVKKVESLIRKYKLNIKGRYRRKYSIDKTKLDINNPIICYYIGLIYTDGYIDYKNNRVSVRCRNRGVKHCLEVIKKELNFDGEIRVYKDVDYDLTIPSEDLIDFLVNTVGFTGTKQEYSKLNLNKHFNMFLRGILDGDGNIHNGTFRITLKNENQIKYLHSVISNIVECNYKKVRGKYYEITLNKIDSKILLDFIYSTNDGLWFEDKHETYLGIDDIV